jgi:hypothetical protein
MVGMDKVPWPGLTSILWAIWGCEPGAAKLIILNFEKVVGNPYLAGIVQSYEFV